jgi:hypothetical protein
MPLDGTIVAPADATRDVRNADTRFMLTISNLAYLNDFAIMAMVRQFERAFRIEMAKDIEVGLASRFIGRADSVQDLTSVVAQVDKILFDELVKHKSQQMTDILRQGILHNNFDWLNAPKPTGSSVLRLGSSIDIRCRGSRLRLRNAASSGSYPRANDCSRETAGLEDSFDACLRNRRGRAAVLY